MKIESIKIENFRNISSANFKFHPNVNFILGKNGVGKTNLVEAIYVNFFSKSFRTSHLKECLERGKENFRISSVVNLKGARHNLTIEYRDGFKTLKIDGKKYLIGEYIKYGMIFVITAESSKIIYGEPSLRRKFFDSIIIRFNPDYIHHLSRFRKIYKNKVELIRKGIKDRSAYHLWNIQLAEVYREIFKKRKEIVDILNHIVKYDFLVDVRKSISIIYSPSLDFNLYNVDKIVEILDRNLEKELERGYLLFGPHRDSFEFFYSGEPAKVYASAGEKRSILLNIFLKLFELMERKLGELPVFIFDDIETEIDIERLKKVLNSLYLKAQIFATSSKSELLNNFIFDKKIINL